MSDTWLFSTKNRNLKWNTKTKAVGLESMKGEIILETEP